jgi:hypothetical protein
MRIRVGGKYMIAEGLDAEARLTTTSDGNDANNPHWDFGDGADGNQSIGVGVDRFFLTYHCCEAFTLKGGKQPHAFQGPPVFGEFVWDEDVHPAGVTAVWKPLTEGKLSGDLRVAEYIAVEDSNDADLSMFGAQGTLSFKASDNTSFTGAVSYMMWNGLAAAQSAGKEGANQGNTDLGAGEFGILDAWLSGSTGQLTGFFQYLNNSEDEDDEDSGCALGARYGKSGHKGDFNVFATYYDFDANAVYTPVAQDDTPIPGTGTGQGMSGVIAGVQHFYSDNTSLKLWALTSDADEDEDPFRVRFDIDFNVK